MANVSVLENLDKFDIVGVRKDGGVDLVISCLGPLDGSSATRAALEQKIRNYVREVKLATEPTFFERYGCSPNAKIVIFVSCEHEVDPKVCSLIADLQVVAAEIGSRIKLVKSMA